MKYLLLVSSLFLCTFFSFSQSQQVPIKLNDSTYISSDSVRLYVSAKGRGSTCIFIHGGPGAWSRSFESMGGANLSSALHMYFYDQRGCGRSQDAPNGDYSLARMVKDIEDIRIITGSEKVYIMAHSFGGILAVKYAEQYPVHVKGLILVNVTLNLTLSLRSQIKYINEVTGSHIPDNENNCLPAFNTAATTMRDKQLSYKILSDSKSATDKLDSIDATNPGSYTFARLAFGLNEYFDDFIKSGISIKAPVLVIAGKKDHAIGMDHYKLFRFPDQQTVVIDGGHILYYEKNKEFLQAVSSFTNKIDRQSNK